MPSSTHEIGPQGNGNLSKQNSRVNHPIFYMKKNSMSLGKREPFEESRFKRT